MSQAGLQGRGASAVPQLSTIELPVQRWLAGRRPIVVIGLFWAIGAFHAVPTGHVGIIERFGEPVQQTDGSGLVVRLPAPIERVTLVDIGSERQLHLDAATYLTGDQSMISLDAVIRFAVTDAELYAYTAADPDRALEEFARAAIAEVVARQNQDALLTTGRAEVERALLGALQVRVDSAKLGVTVSDMHLTNVTVPAPVVAAFLDVISADEERQTKINQAEAYAADLLPRTRGEAVAAIVGAQGAAAQIDAQAQGYAEWFRAVQRNGQRAPGVNQTRLAAEAREIRLQKMRLIAAPSGVRIWLGNEEYGSRDPDTQKGGQGR